MTVCYLAALVSDETIALWCILLFLGIYVDVPLYGWNNWHFPATIGGFFGTIGTLKYSVQDVAGEVCMSDNRMAPVGMLQSRFPV